MNSNRVFFICTLTTGLLNSFSSIQATWPLCAQNAMTQAGVTFTAYMFGMKKVEPQKKSTQLMSQNKRILTSFGNHFLQRLTFENNL